MEARRVERTLSPAAKWDAATFTDFVLVDAPENRIHLHKCPTTPGDPSIAALDALAEMMRPHAEVQHDLDEGLVTLRGARRGYGCVVGPDERIDHEASKALRAARSPVHEPAE